ncbi:MAG: protoporphyrinogen oxidase HemJ [Proteobacteria bacterium]|nr:protoporphyrinogen oxidase HemJ [Pseudomonadota bacterium]
MYLYIKILHILAFVSWMAGLFYLPRLFVYHVENQNIEAMHAVFLTMQRKLFKFIMMPAHIVTYLTGFHLMMTGDFMQQPWMHVKLFFVLLLTFYHYYLYFCHKKLINNVKAYSGRYFRVLNEVPTIILIVVVSLVILKPF